VVHARTAVGAESGVAKINVAGNNAASSSILNMGELHIDSAPDSVYTSVEEVGLVTIDSLFSRYAKKEDSVCLKMDVQGYEDQVLMGAEETLKIARVVKLELSLVSLYEGDKLYSYYFSLLEGLGFSLWDLMAGHRHPATGRLLQFDAVFVRD
jgi:FkbM family methyltransferase